jgi:predicted RNase H-like nuclease (RuvC/YqgF family)
MNNLLRSLRKRFSLAASNLAVRPHRPWYWRWTMVVVGGGLVTLFAWWAYTNGLDLAWFMRQQTESELSRSKREVGYLQGENAKLNTRLVEMERQMQIEHSANTELEKQLKILNDEKTHINEDLAFFQNLTQSGNREENLTIQRLKVTHDTLPGEYHCSLLLVQGGQRAKDFKGKLQFVVNGIQNGQRAVLVIPADKSPEIAAYELDFKYYQRIERSFKLPAGMAFESLQVRIYEHGANEPKVKQEVTLS